MKSSRAISRVKCLQRTDVSDIRSLMMGTEMVLETSDLYRHFTGLIGRENFIEFSSRESFRSYNSVVDTS